MSAHTPGPWSITFPMATNPVAVVWCESHGDIAFIHRSSPSQRHVGIETEEAKRNARLIASAPDMLGALAAAKVALHMFTSVPATSDNERRMIFKLDPQDFLQIRQIEEMIWRAIENAQGVR